MPPEVIQSIDSIEIKTSKLGIAGKEAQGMTSSADQAEAPAGGTGAEAGAYDTAAHRDVLIKLVNEMRAALIAIGIIKGSA